MVAAWVGLTILLLIALAMNVLVFWTLLVLRRQMESELPRTVQPEQPALREDVKSLQRAVAQLVQMAEAQTATLTGLLTATLATRDLIEDALTSPRTDTPPAILSNVTARRSIDRTDLGLEELARRFLAECDQKPIEALSDAPSWLMQHGCSIEQLDDSSPDWFLAVLASKGHGLVVPNMRRPMGRVDLGAFFDFEGYNGIEPLRPEKVGRFGIVARASGIWTVTEKGLIRG